MKFFYIFRTDETFEDEKKWRETYFLFFWGIGIQEFNIFWKDKFINKPWDLRPLIILTAASDKRGRNTEQMIFPATKHPSQPQ